jgi:hypothetical protein
MIINAWEFRKISLNGEEKILGNILTANTIKSE